MEPQDTNLDEPREAGLFAQLPVIFIKLGLHRKMTPRELDGYLTMLSHTTRGKRGHPENGVCAISARQLARELGLDLGKKNLTQAYRLLDLYEDWALFKPVGFKRVGKSCIRKYLQCTGQETWENAKQKNLVPASFEAELSFRAFNKREKQRAEEAEAQEQTPVRVTGKRAWRRESRDLTPQRGPQGRSRPPISDWEGDKGFDEDFRGLVREINRAGEQGEVHTGSR